MKELGLGTLNRVVEFEKGRLTVFKTAGIAALVKLLGSPSEKIVTYALATLHKLMRFQGLWI